MMIGIKQFNLVGCFIFLKKLLTFDDKRVIREISGGQLQRAGICRASCYDKSTGTFIC